MLMCTSNRNKAFAKKKEETGKNLGHFPDMCLISVKKHVPDDKHCLLFVVIVAVSRRQQDSLLTVQPMAARV